MDKIQKILDETKWIKKAEKDIWKLIEKRKLDEVLAHPDLIRIKDMHRRTPAEILTNEYAQDLSAVKKILKNKEVKKVIEDVLMQLADWGSTPVQKMLIKHKDITKSRSNNRSSTLHWLATRHNKNILGDLLRHPQISKLKDKDGSTPLHSLATNFPGEDAVLKHKDADKVKDNRGRTPKDESDDAVGYLSRHSH